MKEEADLGQLVIKDLEVVAMEKAVQVQVDQGPWEAKKIKTPNSSINGRSLFLHYHMTMHRLPSLCTILVEMRSLSRPSLHSKGVIKILNLAHWLWR